MPGAWWAGRPVLITGVTGFVGSALAARLLDGGARVVGLVKEEEATVDPRLTVVRGDVTDESLLPSAVAEHQVEIVYHLAAQAIVGVANRSPIETFKTNIEGTWNLLEACRGRPHVRAIVVASSDKAYGAHTTLPYREEFPLNPQYPYDVSKACADLIARSYWHTYQMPVVITRFANIYGPGDRNFSRIVPDTIRSVVHGKPPVIRSDGTPERDYLYIEDVVDLYLVLAERIEVTAGEIFNAGHNRPISVRQVVETILKLADRPDLTPEIQGRGTPHGEIDRQWLDAGKAKRLLGWAPRVRLDDGLKKTLAWYQAFLAREG